MTKAKAKAKAKASPEERPALAEAPPSRTADQAMDFLAEMKARDALAHKGFLRTLRAYRDSKRDRRAVQAVIVASRGLLLKRHADLFAEFATYVPSIYRDLIRNKPS